MSNHHKYKRHGHDDAPFGDHHQYGGREDVHGSPGYGNPGYGNPGYDNPAYGNPGHGRHTDNDFWQGMSTYLPARHMDQFLIGLALGAGAAWVLSDEELRGKMIKAGMKLYANVAGGFEELKEQMSDIRSEVAAERHGDE